MALITILLFAWIAGLASFAGGFLAFFEKSENTVFKKALGKSVVAFGGGLLVSAIAFALLPEGMNLLSPAVMTLTFISGGVIFAVIDVAISKTGGAKSQFMAMLMDFLPESISMGAAFMHNRNLGILLAGFIGLQNLPEGFNAYKEIISGGVKKSSALSALFIISFLGPLAAGIGYVFLQNKPEITATLMSFASGGILYLIFQDIAPESRMEKHWQPTLGAVLGFALGMLGKQLIG
ncbi:MAG: ZIP family metal transporter [Deltaproteobacteria bacterium]|nr:ZIP family metal transporter [Deltaproteobacteria bacterium]